MGAHVDNPQITYHISDESKVLGILKNRLPKSCFIYNAARMSSRFPEQTKIFVIGEEIDESSWIIITHFTENYGTQITISANQETSKISKSEAIKFLSEFDIIQWNKPHWFVALEDWVSEIIYEISVTVKGNVITVHPDVLFYMDPKESLELVTRSEDPRVKLQKLDLELGAEFVVKTWKFAKPGTREVVRRIIESNESGGVYLDDKPICCVTTHGYGLLSMLYTDNEHRNKGYAKLCMQFAFQQLAKNGLIPASSVDVINTASIKFHEKLGFKNVGPAIWIYCEGNDWENSQ